MNSYFHVLRNYFQFSGRASRREFWMFTLINTLVAFIFGSVGFVLSNIFKDSGSEGEGVFQAIVLFGPIILYSIFVLIPSLAVSVRRLHDTNRRGWWLLMNFVPLGNLVLIVFLCLKGTDGVNRFDKTVPDNEDEELFTFEDENNEELSEERKEEILEDVKELGDKDPVAAGMPQNLIIGYIEEITKKGLKEYIIGQTYKYFPSPHYTVYRIEKYNKGFIYEIHDGGNKLTHLKKIKEEFDAGENELILKTAGNYVKVAKSGHKLDCMILQDSDLEYDDENAKIIDSFDMAKMEEAVPLGAGTFLTGLMFLSFGIISLFFSVLFKYGLLSLEEKPDDVTSELNEMPHERFEKLPAPTQYSYVEKLYLEGNEWKVTRKELERSSQEDQENNNLSPDFNEELMPDDVQDLYLNEDDAINEDPTDATYENEENMVEDSYEEPTQAPYTGESNMIEDQPLNEQGEPVNIFEVDDSKVINEDMVEREVVDDINPDVLTNSPN